MAKSKEVKRAAARRSRRVSNDAPLSEPADVSMQVFTLGEVAEILQAPKSRVKNWTIGRPLKIVPRVLAGQGKGSRNLFALNDVYVMALVNQLYSDGLSMSAIEYLVDGAFLGPVLGPVKHLEFRRGADGKWGARLGTGEFKYKEVQPSGTEVKAQASPGRYILDVKALMGVINSRIATVLQRRQYGHIQEG